MTIAADPQANLNVFGERRIRSAFGPSTTATEALEGVDLTSKIAIVTGAANGIGFETARALSLAGASVTIADVDEAKGLDAASTINAEAGREAATFRKLDLGSAQSCRAFAADFMATGRKLDILINNAGVMAPPLKRTADGHELQFGINHLGHFVLTTSLVPALEAGGGARVVVLSSIGHRRSDIIYEDPNYHTRPYERWEAYSQSKTACALFAVGLNKRFAGRGIFANAMNPGGSMTGLQQFVGEEEQRQLGWIDEKGNILSRWRSPAECAATSVWLATAPEVEGIGGRYFEFCNESGPWTAEVPHLGVQPFALLPENADRLWALSEDLTAA